MSNLPNFISAGVFTEEIDHSGIAQGVADIGAVIVAPFEKGVGFSPTICKSITELQTEFGISDGTFYGPYTAAQYLQEKGFVTVCRVGALTGYHQKYPLIIWAESGQWTRAGDIGCLAVSTGLSPQSDMSFIRGITPTTVTFTGSAVDLGGGSSSVSGALLFSNQPVSVVLASGVGTGQIGTVNNSGSVLYNNQTIAGVINNVSVPFNGTLFITASATSAQILNEILFNTYSQFTGSILNNDIADQYETLFNSSTFNSIDIEPFMVSSSISKSFDNCSNPLFLINGWLSGSFNKFDGGFNSNSGVFDTCSLQWLGSPNYKVLAVLADTQWAGINTNLEAPGFLGSSAGYTDAVSGSDEVVDTFKLSLSSSLGSGYGTYNFSLNESDPQYITNVFGNIPTAGNPATYAIGTKIEAAYLYNLYSDSIAAVVQKPSLWKVHFDAMPSGSWINEPLNFTDAYSLTPSTGDSQYSLTNAYTPWVLSQEVAAWNGGSPTRFNLFQLQTIADGTYTNTSYKIEISNVKLAGTVAGSNWGTFTLSVRAFSDTDKRPVYLEQFNGLTLDPTSPNFIARAIGDRYNYINYNGKIIEFGTYSNNSQYIRVVMSDVNYPSTAVPYGFSAYSTPIDGAMGFHVPPVAYTKASVYGLFAGKYASGVDFTGVPAGADSELIGLYPTSSVGGSSYSDNQQYFSPVPAGSTAGSNQIFALDLELTGSSNYGVSTGSFIVGSNIIPAIYDAANETTYVKMRKFMFGFQGGFDGQSPAIDINVGDNITAGNTQGLNCANSLSAGSIAYTHCINALGNADEFDINLIVTPGIIYSLHSYVTNLVIDMCENRGDCFYVADLYEDGGNPATGQIDQVVSLAGELDTSYAGTYYPWIKILDTNINQIVTVPPSVVMPAIYANNDNVGGEWWAVAGLNRGGIPNAVGLTDRTTHLERDTLYEGRVNPLVSFPNEGFVVWGQKTLQVHSSALDRINVRRLLIAIKKYIASISKYLVFEQNTTTTRNKFLSIVNPYLESVQQRSGLYAFQVIMDDTNNTAAIIDQNVLVGSIAIQPTKTAEFIYLPFTVLPTGASFPTA